MAIAPTFSKLTMNVVLEASSSIFKSKQKQIVRSTNYTVSPMKTLCLKGLSIASSSFWNSSTPLRLHCVPHQCQSQYSSSDDDEYRSSRNIAISLVRRYWNVVDRGGGDTLKEFIVSGVNAYALGCTDEGLRKELNDLKAAGVELETFAGSTGPKSKIISQDVEESIKWVSLVFITILCTPQPTVVRWSSSPPVTSEMLIQWKGFCAIIANAYFMRGMAWLPVKTLQLEQLAVMGRAEEPSLVASRMRLVFSTLEVNHFFNAFCFGMFAA